MDGHTNFISQLKGEGRGEAYGAFAAAHRALVQHQMGSKRRQQEILRFRVGAFTIVNACNNVRPTAECSVAPDIMLTVMPAAAGSVEIYGVDNEGRLRGGEQALVRVLTEDAQVLLRYDISDMPDGIPNIIVRKLSISSEWSTLRHTYQSMAELSKKTDNIQVHFEKRGDVNGSLGEWLGTFNNPLGIEGFSISSWAGLADKDIMYRAILSESWESPWHSGGTYCGSRGLDFPINGLVIKLSKEAAALYHLSYSGLFRDGTVIGPVNDGERCASADYQPLIGLHVTIERCTV